MKKRQQIKSPWPFGTRWLWSIFYVYGWVELKLAEPTALQIVCGMHADTNREITDVYRKFLIDQSQFKATSAYMEMLNQRASELFAEIQRLTPQEK